VPQRTTIEEYVEVFRHLPKEVTGTLQPFFPENLLHKMKVVLKPSDWLFFGASGRGRPTPCFVLFGTIYVAEGILNHPMQPSLARWGNHCDLTTPGGWEFLAHELFHVVQYKRAGVFGMLGKYIGGIAKSLFGRRRLWDHSRIPFEQEAIEFGAVVRRRLAADKPAEFFKLFDKRW
jgi:hypothetical protein